MSVQSEIQYSWKLAKENAMNDFLKCSDNAKVEIAEFCHDIENDWSIDSFDVFKIVGGELKHKQWIEDAGFEVCRKKDASCYLQVGMQTEQGNFIIGKYKTYWLRVK